MKFVQDKDQYSTDFDKATLELKKLESSHVDILAAISDDLVNHSPINRRYLGGLGGRVDRSLFLNNQLY